MPNTEPASPRRPPRVVIAGARGRLGRSFCEIALRNHWPIHGWVHHRPTVGTVRAETPPFVGADSVPSADAEGLADLLRGADLYVSAVPGPAERALLPRVAQAGIPAVVAGTGLDDRDTEWIDRIVERIPLVWEPNYSIGIQWLTQCVLRRPLPPGFDRGVVEVHHRGKADRPSGTARVLAQSLRSDTTTAEDRGRSPPAPVDLASLRVADVAGVHQVWLTAPEEMIRIEHVVLDRAVFARGMFAAASALWEQNDSTPGRRSLAGLWSARGGIP